MNYFTPELFDVGSWIVLVVFILAVIALGLFFGAEPEGVIICPKCDRLMAELPPTATNKAICPACGFKERRRGDTGAGHRRQSDKEKS